MKWNWEMAGWPNFRYEPERISQLDRQFLLEAGGCIAYLKTIDDRDYKGFAVEMLSLEGAESSKIEGEVLDRESLQSSIQQHFGLHVAKTRVFDKESRMAALLCDVYESFAEPLTHEMLWRWHAMLFDGLDLENLGTYRTHKEPMQIVSNRYGSRRVFFEAPPSKRLFSEMEAFIQWFNSKDQSQSILGRASLAHVYFESIHPFEDGNGRIGRILVEKILSQEVGQPLLMAVSNVLEKKKKEYYLALENCNRTLDVQPWVDFFSRAILQAREESMQLLFFIIQKSKMMHSLSGKINPRQTKVLLRMFKEGPSGFKGGLSAENYIKIAKTTRSTATRDLADLVEFGALTKMGSLRHTRYYLNLSNEIT
ncbi:MAG TPA: DUF4172 domain-containing protein [Parachlamydiales bacterium]|nr:DUF4172 domain-containing protein [Parachlamydiales bacterium]